MCASAIARNNMKIRNKNSLHKYTFGTVSKLKLNCWKWWTFKRVRFTRVVHFILVFTMKIKSMRKHKIIRNAIQPKKVSSLILFYPKILIAWIPCRTLPLLTWTIHSFKRDYRKNTFTLKKIRFAGRNSPQKIFCGMVKNILPSLKWEIGVVNCIYS